MPTSRKPRVFIAKPIHLGLYLFNYFALDYSRLAELDWEQTGKDLTIPMDLVQFQFERAGNTCGNGRIEAIQLLGSYLCAQIELDQARWVADFCQSL